MSFETGVTIAAILAGVWTFRRKPRRVPLSRVTMRDLPRIRPVRRARPVTVRDLSLRIGYYVGRAKMMLAAMKAGVRTGYEQGQMIHVSPPVVMSKPDEDIGDSTSPEPKMEIPVSVSLSGNPETVPVVDIIQMLADIKHGWGKTESLRKLSGYSGRRHKLYSETWDTLKISVLN